MKNQPFYKKGTTARTRAAQILSMMLALALAATMCVCPTTQNITKAYANDATPSLSTYATKSDLMTKFTPDTTTGVADNIGKISFGKQGNESLEWYVFGNDVRLSSSMRENNIIVLSVNATNQSIFQKGGSNTSTETFTVDVSGDTDFGEYSSTKPSTVYLNHYGASVLRDNMQAMASDTSVFSSGEQALLNTSKVTSQDVNNDVSYVTQDAIYAPSGKVKYGAIDFIPDPEPWEDGGGTIIPLSTFEPMSSVIEEGDELFIQIGSYDSKTLALSSYAPKTEGTYWLRNSMEKTGVGSQTGYAVKVNSSSASVGTTYTNEYTSAYMLYASNINITDVLFASAAPAATSTTATGGSIATDNNAAVMSLRMDGTSKTIGRVGVDAENGTIVASKNAEAGTVSLVVQGNDSTGTAGDWYYTKQIGTDTETITVSDIQQAAGCTTPTLSNCKVWLETTDSDGLTYAVEPEESVTVTFYLDGEELEKQGLFKGDTATEPTVEYDKSKYTFDGWYEKQDYTGATFNFATEIKQSTELYAKLVQNEYTVTFDVNGGTGLSQTKVTVKSGKTVSKPTPDPTREGHTFKYWALDGKEFDFTTPITKDITLQAVWDKVTPDEKRELKRLSGEDADQTAAAISREGFTSSKYAIVARWDDFADALGASGLAGTLDCPILLTRLDALSEATAKELERLGAETVYVIGGTGAISEQIDKDLDGIACVKTHERIWGEYSWDTSLECANAIAEHSGNPNSEAIVAVSFNFQDALSISSYAYHYKVPLILEDNSYGVAGTLTNDAVSFIKNTTGTIWVAGGYVAVGKETVEDVFTGRTITRLWGEDGYDTSNQIATHMTKHNLLSAYAVGMACGGQKAHGVDALAGAALIGKQRGVMLLFNANPLMEAENYTTIDKGSDSQGNASYLTANKADVTHAYVLGGNVVAPETFFNKVKSILGM